MKILVTTLSIICLNVFASFGQTVPKHEVHHPKGPHSGERHCTSSEYNEKLARQNPAFKEYMEHGSKLQLKKYIAGKSSAKTSMMTVITIPVVVHVIYENGESIGTGSNISDAQINAQIDILNEDFRRQNADTTNTPVPFLPVAGDAHIEFQLATLDPGGSPTTGITRTMSDTAEFDDNFDNMKFSASGGVDIWDRDKYLNIWVCDMNGNTLGFAQFPGGPANTDGVVLDYRYMGSGGATSAPYDLGRTGTHEVGHWLDLYHTWGDGDCTDDDLVGDTPNCDGEHYAKLAGGCVTPGEQCASAGDRMIENYMDYSDDGCMNLFTQGQITRMRAAIDGPRASIKTSNGLGNPTDKPYTNFTANSTSVVAGSNVTFTNLTSGDTAVLWSFPGGSPTSSTDQNPVVNYASVGQYDVTLTAYNSNGDSTVTKIDYIDVTSTPACWLITDNYNGSDSLILWDDGAGGHISGHNQYTDRAKAEKFQNPSPFDLMTQTKFYFGDADATTPGLNVTFIVWDGSGANPGTILATKDVLLADIKSDVDAGDTTTVIWDSPVSITDDFFVGFRLDYNGGYTQNFVAVYTNEDGETTPATAWEFFADSLTWAPLSDASSWDLDISFAIYPLMKISTPTGTSTEDVSEAITVYPNPATDELNFMIGGTEIESITLINSVGQAVYSGSYSSGSVSVDVSGLKPGVYSAIVGTGINSGTKKVIIR